MKKRARIVSGLAALAALLLAPLAEASISRVSSAERAMETPALSLAASANAPELSEFSLFEGTELAAAASESERAPSFHPLAAVSLLSKDGARLPLVSVDELSYPKTRYRVFGLLGTPILGELRGVSLELHWGCASFSRGFASGTVGWLSQDPMGDRDSVNLYGFVGARPHEKTDPLGLAVVRRNPTADQWADLQEAVPELRNDRPDVVPSGGGASIGGAFRRHGAEIGTVVGGMAVTVGTEAVIFYAQGKVAELGIRLVLRGATHLFRTLQEATAFARSQGAAVGYVEEAASGAPMLSARGTKFEGAAATGGPTKPNSAARRYSQGGFLHPESNVYVLTNERLAADHIFPQQLIKELPGFAELSAQNQQRILNYLPNFQGLPRSFNSSKGKRLAAEWARIKGNPIHPDYQAWLSQTQGLLKDEIQELIATLAYEQSLRP